MEYEESSDVEEKSGRSTPPQHYDIMHLLLKLGQAHSISQVPFMDNNGLPIVTYSNIKNGELFTAFMWDEIFRPAKIIKFAGYDPNCMLWKETDYFTEFLRERCIESLPDPVNEFPILHRHSEHRQFTEDPLTADDVDFDF